MQFLASRQSSFLDIESPPEIIRGATFGDRDDLPVYRYTLWRHWGETESYANFLMLNPSTADAGDDDPTVKKCIKFARRAGLDGIKVTNLFAIRATDPDKMLRDKDPVGPENDRWIHDIAEAANLVICAWGNDGKHRGRSEQVVSSLLSRGLTLHALKVNNTGEPAHPLFLPYRLTPTLWRSTGASK